MKNRVIQSKNRSNFITKIMIFGFATFGIAILLIMFYLLIAESVPAYKEYGFFHMYFTADFSAAGKWGIWGGLSITLITSIIAVIIATPLALRMAIFMRYRLKKGRKPLKILVNILAGVPSVVFGIFALKSLTGLSEAFNINSGTSIFSGILVLIIMIFPTLVSMIYNQLTLVDQDLINSSIALGNTKTTSIYKVVKKDIKSGIIVSAIAALGRAIGETMALSMILTTNPLANPFSKGLSNFFNSSSASLGVMIARLMFSDSSDPNIKSALFASGVALFVTVMFLIMGATRLANKKIIKNLNPIQTIKKLDKDKFPATSFYYIYFMWFIFTFPFRVIRFILAYVFEISIQGIKNLGSFTSNLITIFLFKQHNTNREKYIFHSQSRLSKVTDTWRIFVEYISIFIISGSIGWIVFDIFLGGLPHWTPNLWKWTYAKKDELGYQIHKGAILNTLVFTVVLILISITLALPFAVATALYLSEYAGNKKSGRIIKFFLDSLGGTPSIIFGIFGVVLFRQYFNLGNGGFSLIAGALTMVIVIIPSFTRVIEQVLVKIPEDIRAASYALGASKFETIRKVVLPEAMPGIISGVILSAGRVVSETAPVYLTIGMLGNASLDLNGQGWTMTTKILYNQIYDSVRTSQANLNESYAIAAANMLLITSLILLSELIQWSHQKKIFNKLFKRNYNFSKVKYKKSSNKLKGIKNV